MSWVFRHSEAKLGARLVLLCLAEFAHDDGSRAFPSVATMCERTRMSERGVQEALRRLEADGMIERREKPLANGTNVYRVLMGGADSAPGGVQQLREGGAAAAPDPSSDPSVDRVVVEGQGSLLGDEPAKPKPAPRMQKLVGSVAGKAVTDAEYELAVAVLGAFNTRAERNFTGKEWLKTILMRIRENPEMTLEDFAAVVERAFLRPWWGKDDPTPAVVFSGKAFDIARNATRREQDEDDGLSIYDK